MGLFKDFKQLATAFAQSKTSELLEKARTEPPKKNYIIDRKAIDSIETSEGMEAGYKDRNYGITFDILRQMSYRNSIVASIIQTRVLQVKKHCYPQPDKYSHGFRIKLRDDKEKSTPEDEKKIQQVETFILNTGGDEGRPEKFKMNFCEFLGRLTRDALTYDQVAIETILDKAGNLAYFLPVSAGSIRFAARSTQSLSIDLINQSPLATYNEEMAEREAQIRKEDKKRPDEDYKYVQVYQGQIIRGFFDDELLLEMVNPTNELLTNGYSIGPLEMAASIVSYHLLSEAHNKLFFVQGVSSKGLLNIKGEVNKMQLDAFRRQIHSQIVGTNNAHRLPIVAGENEVEWVDMGQMSNKDMEFNSWMEYLIKILCSLYSIDPQEINFDITRSAGPSLSESGSKSKTAAKESKDKGLQPLLKFFEGIINEKIIKKFDESLYLKYQFEFCGDDDNEDAETELDRIEREVKSYKTINEVRAERDLPPLKECGDIILDTNFIQVYSSFSQEAKDKAEKEMNANADDGQLGQFLTEGDKDAKAKKKDDKTKKSLGSNPKLIKVEYFEK